MLEPMIYKHLLSYATGWLTIVVFHFINTVMPDSDSSMLGQVIYNFSAVKGERERERESKMHLP